LEVLADSNAVSKIALLRDIPHASIIHFYQKMIFISDCSENGRALLTRCLKWITVAQSATYLRQEVPPCPYDEMEIHLGVNPFQGRFKKLIDNLLHRAPNYRTDTFFNGVLQGVKRGCETVPEEFVDEARLDHILALTQSQPTETKLLQSIGRKIRSVVSGSVPIEPTGLKVVEPSGRASYQTGIGKGGARQGLLSLIREQMDEGLVSMEEVRPGQVEEVRGTPRLRGSDLADMVGDSLKRTRRVSLDCPPGETYLGTHARVAAVLEPLKVRLITAGDEVNQYLALSLQRDLFRWMKEIEPLTLTNRPLEGLDLYTLVDKTKKLGLPTECMVSGDYKAATDNLHMDVCRLGLEKVLAKLGPELKGMGFDEICRSILLEQVIETSFEVLVIEPEMRPFMGEYLGGGVYGPPTHLPQVIGMPGTYLFPLEVFAKYHIGVTAPSDRPVFWNGVPEHHGDSYTFTVRYLQRNGQLMGSVLSFPFLCIANLAAYWLALDRYMLKKGLPLVQDVNQLPVLVNGDDILFFADSDLQEIWKDVVGGIGFKLSVGKNYASKDYCMVNSSLWRILRDTTGQVTRFRSIPYLNCGLLTGQAKVSNRNSEKYKTDLASMYNEMMYNATDRVRAHSRFLHYNMDEVRTLTRDGLFNLFGQRVMGGCGFHLYPEVRTHYQWYLTPFQERLACFMDLNFLRGRPEEDLASAWNTNLFQDKPRDPARKGLSDLHGRDTVTFPLSLSKNLVKWDTTFGPLREGWSAYRSRDAAVTFVGKERSPLVVAIQSFLEKEGCDMPLDRPSEGKIRFEMTHAQWRDFMSFPHTKLSRIGDYLCEGRWLVYREPMPVWLKASFQDLWTVSDAERYTDWLLSRCSRHGPNPYDKYGKESWLAGVLRNLNPADDPNVAKLELDSRMDKLSHESTTNEETNQQQSPSEGGYQWPFQEHSTTSSERTDPAWLSSQDELQLIGGATY
jgi:hypothetical protein